MNNDKPAIKIVEENEKFEKTLQDFRKHYMVHNMDNTKPYPDVMEILPS